uniref:Uncharacterized protein n=1 Tax=Sphaerodactylus townsendi TaxID=933632 RepID=A0ACB8FEG5_9SAUR
MGTCYNVLCSLFSNGIKSNGALYNKKTYCAKLIGYFLELDPWDSGKWGKGLRAVPCYFPCSTYLSGSALWNLQNILVSSSLLKVPYFVWSSDGKNAVFVFPCASYSFV